MHRGHAQSPRQRSSDHATCCGHTNHDYSSLREKNRNPPNNSPHIKSHIKYMTRMDIFELSDHLTYLPISRILLHDQRKRPLTTSQIPQLDGLVVARADQPPTPWVKRQCSHKCFVSHKRAKTLPSRRGPYLDLAVIRARDNQIILHTRKE